MSVNIESKTLSAFAVELLWYGPNNRGIWLRFSKEALRFTLFHGVHTSFTALISFLEIVTANSFPGVKAAG